MKLTIELSDSAEEEIKITCREITSEIQRLQELIVGAGLGKKVFPATRGNEDFFIPRDSILFFETDSDKTVLHTANGMFYTTFKLYELEQMLPRSFVRISKSAIINSVQISSLSRNITSSSEARFYGSDKKVYVSRRYYRTLIDIIAQSRL